MSYSCSASVAPLSLQELEWAKIGLYEHGEVMGLDKHGEVVAWDGQTQSPYHLNLTASDAIVEAHGFLEVERIERDARQLGIDISHTKSFFR